MQLQTQLLTVRKQRWVKSRKPALVRGKALIPSAAAQARYYGQLRKLIMRMSADTQRTLMGLFDTANAKEFFANDASVSNEAKILMDALIKKFQNLFDFEAKPLADGMADDAQRTSASSLKGSLKELSGGLTLNTDILTGELREVIQAIVTENVGLIKSIATQYLAGVQGAVFRSITTGNGLADLVPFLQKHEGITLRRARLISLDQSRKAYSSINKHRMESVGVASYEWLHVNGGQHPRKLHQEYSGKVFRLSDPPVIDLKTGERGIPGQLINCRCRMIPVINFDTGENENAA